MATRTPLGSHLPTVASIALLNILPVIEYTVYPNLYLEDCYQCTQSQVVTLHITYSRVLFLQRLCASLIPRPSTPPVFDRLQCILQNLEVQLLQAIKKLEV